jgi:hypothetical protein
VPAPKRFNKGSISVPEGALRHFRCHPCRVFSFSYRSKAPFQGDDTISKIQTRRRPWQQSLDVYCRRLGEHRRWSQNGHNKSAILTS